MRIFANGRLGFLVSAHLPEKLPFSVIAPKWAANRSIADQALQQAERRYSRRAYVVPLVGFRVNRPSQWLLTRESERPKLAGSTRPACCHKAVFRGNCRGCRRRLRGTGGNSTYRPEAVFEISCPKPTSDNSNSIPVIAKCPTASTRDRQRRSSLHAQLVQQRHLCQSDQLSN